MKHTFVHEGVMVTADLVTIQEQDGSKREIAVDISVDDDKGEDIGIWVDDRRIDTRYAVPRVESAT